MILTSDFALTVSSGCTTCSKKNQKERRACLIAGWFPD